MRQADMILRSAEDSVPEANDLEDIRRRFGRLSALAAAARESDHSGWT
jgi:hypothetical protein